MSKFISKSKELIANISNGKFTKETLSNKKLVKFLSGLIESCSKEEIDKNDLFKYEETKSHITYIVNYLMSDTHYNKEEEAKMSVTNIKTINRFSIDCNSSLLKSNEQLPNINAIDIKERNSLLTINAENLKTVNSKYMSLNKKKIKPDIKELKHTRPNQTRFNSIESKNLSTNPNSILSSTKKEKEEKDKDDKENKEKHVNIKIKLKKGFYSQENINIDDIQRETYKEPNDIDIDNFLNQESAIKKINENESEVVCGSKVCTIF